MNLPADLIARHRYIVKKAMANITISDKPDKKHPDWPHTQLRLAQRAGTNRGSSRAALVSMSEAFRAPGGPDRYLGKGDFYVPIRTESGELLGNAVLQDHGRARGHIMHTFLSPGMKMRNNPKHIRNADLSPAEFNDLTNRLKHTKAVIAQGRRQAAVLRAAKAATGKG